MEHGGGSSSGDWGAEFLGVGGAGTGAPPPDHHAAATPETTRPPWALRVLRSVQLDAGRLDAELLAMLREQLLRALSQGGLLPPARVAALEPEISALLAALVFAGTVARGGATPGSGLMNLRYRDERPFRSSSSALTALARESAAAATAATRAAGRPPPPAWVFGDGQGVEGGALTARQRALFGLGFVLLPYAWARAGRAAAAGARAGGGGGGGGGGRFAAAFGQQPQPQPEEDEGETTPRTAAEAAAALWRRAAPRLEAIWRAAALLNLLAFLRRGVYRTLLERALSARLVPERPCAPRAVSFEYLNRQLVWQELSEFALFALPLLDEARRLRAAAGAWLPAPPSSPAASSDDAGRGGLLGGGGGGGGYCVAAPLPGEEEMEREEREAEERRRQGWRWWGRRGRRRAGDGGGGGGDGEQQQQQQQADSLLSGGAVAGWLAQHLGAAASAMSGAVATGAARAMAGGEGEGEGAASQAAAAAAGEKLSWDEGAPGADADAADADDHDHDPARPPGPCPLCSAGEIVSPYVALPCRHVFCYYCLRANTEGDARFACPVDGRRVRFLRRWAPPRGARALPTPSAAAE